jgi:hypothetical protein
MRAVRADYRGRSLDCMDCIGPQLRRRVTLGVAAAWARAVHVRCASRVGRGRGRFIADRPRWRRQRVQRFQVRWKVPTLSYYYSRRLPVPAAKSTQALTTNCSSASNLTLEGGPAGEKASSQAPWRRVPSHNPVGVFPRVPRSLCCRSAHSTLCQL